MGRQKLPDVGSHGKVGGTPGCTGGHALAWHCTQVCTQLIPLPLHREQPHGAGCQANLCPQEKSGVRLQKADRWLRAGRDQEQDGSGRCPERCLRLAALREGTGLPQKLAAAGDIHHAGPSIQNGLRPQNTFPALLVQTQPRVRPPCPRTIAQLFLAESAQTFPAPLRLLAAHSRRLLGQHKTSGAWA